MTPEQQQVSKIRFQDSSSSNVHCPTMKTTSERIAKFEGNWNALYSKILEHLETKNN